MFPNILYIHMEKRALTSGWPRSPQQPTWGVTCWMTSCLQTPPPEPQAPPPVGPRGCCAACAAGLPAGGRYLYL